MWGVCSFCSKLEVSCLREKECKIAEYKENKDGGVIIFPQQDTCQIYDFTSHFRCEEEMAVN